MSETLKPCPFCGNPPLAWNDDGGSPEGYATISCESGCGNTSISRKLRSGFVIEPEPAEETWRIVRERWNTRADDNRWRSVAEQAEKALRPFADFFRNFKDGMPEHSLLVVTDKQDREIRVDHADWHNASLALAAFDSLRKEKGL